MLRLDNDGGFGFIRIPDGEAYYFDRDNLASRRFEQLPLAAWSSPSRRPEHPVATTPSMQRLPARRNRWWVPVPATRRPLECCELIPPCRTCSGARLSSSTLSGGLSAWLAQEQGRSG